jgi:hypothetical protein
MRTYDGVVDRLAVTAMPSRTSTAGRGVDLSEAIEPNDLSALPPPPLPQPTQVLGPER